MPARIPIDSHRLAEICRRHHIRKLALFGSVLRDDFGPQSDVDVLVDFDPEERITFFDLYDIEEELSAELGGRRVDLVTWRSLKPNLRQRITEAAEVQYAEG